LICALGHTTGERLVQLARERTSGKYPVLNGYFFEPIAILTNWRWQNAEKYF
jgi:hypothetical protein